MSNTGSPGGDDPTQGNGADDSPPATLAEFDRVDQWLQLIAGGLDEGHAPLLVQAAVEVLDERVASQEGMERLTLDAIDAMRAGIDPDTFDDMSGRLTVLLGEDAIYLLAWLSIRPQQPPGAQQRRFEQVGEMASPRVLAYLRSVVGVAGATFETAFERWNRLPDDWHNLERNCILDYRAQAYRLSIGIQKYSGEQTTIEGLPESFLQLASFVIATISAFPEPEDELSENAVDAFASELVDFATTYKLTGRLLAALQEAETLTDSAADG